MDDTTGKREAAARSLHHCGDLGNRNQAGAPCGQVTAPGRVCPFHAGGDSLAKHQKAAALLARLKQARVLPEDAEVPTFESPEEIRRWAGEMAQKVGTGALDSRLADSMRQFAVLALSTHELAVLAKLELLERLAAGKVRPSLTAPLRALSTSRPEGDAAA